jgi:hypothetical protein
MVTANRIRFQGIGDQSQTARSGAEPHGSRRVHRPDDHRRRYRTGHRNEQRRERHRTALRRRYLVVEELGRHPEQDLVAQAELREMEAKTTKPKWRLLVAVAEGHNYADLAVAEGDDDRGVAGTGLPPAPRDRVISKWPGGVPPGNYTISNQSLVRVPRDPVTRAAPRLGKGSDNVLPAQPAPLIPDLS